MARQVFVGPGCEVLAVLEGAPYPRVHVAWTEEEARAWWEGLDEGVVPESEGVAISDEGLRVLVGTARPGDTGELEREYAEGDDEDEAEPALYRLGPRGRRLVACAHPVTGFRAFLGVWRFVNRDRGRVQVLGESVWPGQERFIDVVAVELWVYALKARQLGYTNIACAYDAWVARFRQANARVHLVSRTEDVAKDTLLKPIKFGLEGLPDEMQLPVGSTTTTELELVAHDEDKRVLRAYAAKEPGRAYTCSHLHLDEWAAMAKTSPKLPEDVWGAAESTISKHGGTCHVLTTGVGPTGYYADVWRSCIAGEGQFVACFIPAAGSRPEYTETWLRAKRRAMRNDARFRWEYPETWEDALSGGGDTLFPSRHIDAAAEYARGFSRAGTYLETRTGRQRPRRYVKAWDIAGPGDSSDAVVGIVLDVTEAVWDVVAMIYNRGEEYPVTAWRIEQLHRAYPGPTIIEDNEAGAAVRSFLSLPEDEAMGFRTTSQSKPVILNEVIYALADQTLKWSPDDAPKLDQEMRSYKLPDGSIEQDCVMALSIAVHHGAIGTAEAGGKILSVVRV